MTEAKQTSILRMVPILLVILIGWASAQGKIIYVDDDAPADFDNIQAGIDDANDGDTVLVRSGEYTVDTPVTFRGKPITVKSEAGRDETTIRMGTSDPRSERNSVVIFENDETIASVLDGFTITGGSGCRTWIAEESRFARGGGGILFNASSGTVRNCAIVQNAAEIGGGVGTHSSGSSAILANCIISGNAAEFGGGVECGYDASVTMTECIVSGNRSQGDVGGGVAAWYGSVTMTDCAMVSNTATLVGGGFYVGHGSATLTGCIVARNAVAWGGGGVACSFPEGTSPTITNCTIWGNSVGDQGGGVGCYHGASVTLTNSIICANTAQRGRNISLVDRPTLRITYSNVAGGRTGVNVEGGTLIWGEGNIDADPHFADSTNDDFHVRSQAGRWDPNCQAWVQDEVASPCIDAGSMVSPIGHEPFPNGGLINMGAYGGTAEASKSYFGKPPCETIIAGDVNGDCAADFKDMAIMMMHWLQDTTYTFGDAIGEAHHGNI